MSLFVVVKFVHVLLAIIAVGFNATYGVWLARVAREPVPTQSYVLHGIKRLDDWFANPAYVLLAVTGVTMVLVGELRFTRIDVAQFEQGVRVSRNYLDHPLPLPLRTGKIPSSFEQES